MSANSKTNQSCSKGTLKNGNCIYVPKKTISYKCDEGTLKNGYCYKQAQEENNYTCSVGNLDGSKCYISATKKSNYDAYQSKANDIIDKLIKIAEEAYNNDPNGATYQRFFGLSYDNDWCAAFIWWLFNQDSRTKNLVVKDATADGIVRESVKKGLGTWYEDTCYDKNTKPQKGDLIVFDPEYGTTGMYIPYPLRTTNNYPSVTGFNDRDQYLSSHIGIVVDVDKDGTIHTIEGNKGNVISKGSYSSNYCGNEASSEQRINGFYRPNYNK